MPLKLEPLEKKPEEVEFGKVKLIVPGRIPMELMLEFYDLRDMDTEKPTSKDLRDILSLTKKALYLENDKGKVDDFFKPLVPKHINKITAFVMNYLLECQKEDAEETEEESKKKDSKAVSAS